MLYIYRDIYIHICICNCYTYVYLSGADYDLRSVNGANGERPKPFDASELEATPSADMET